MINARKSWRTLRRRQTDRPVRNAADLLTQLDELRQHGVLTEAEFQKQEG